MRIYFVTAFFAVACAQLTLAQQKSYNGYKVFSAYPSSNIQVEALSILQQESKFDFWSDPAKKDSTDIMVAPNEIQNLMDYLNAFHIKHSVMIEDVEKLVVQERVANEEALRRNGRNLNWTAYHTFDDIMIWLDSLPQQYPELATVFTIGYSTEFRPLRMIKISNGGPQNKTAIFIDGTFHAREWISPATVTYFINDLLVNYESNKHFLDHVDFYIVPFVNPDGYEFSRLSTRMWRKTRSTHNSTCFGVDPNRNFGYHFGGAGTSGDKCSDIYRGPHEFSEPETRAVRDFLTHTKVDWQVYITVHSYGQYILIPWSYAEVYPIDFDEMLELAEDAARALTAVHGTPYVCGQSAITLSPTAGCSDDWAKSEGIKYSYTYELRDRGNSGFILPPSQIIPTAQETIEAIKVMARKFTP